MCIKAHSVAINFTLDRHTGVQGTNSFQQITQSMIVQMGDVKNCQSGSLRCPKQPRWPRIRAMQKEVVKVRKDACRAALMSLPSFSEPCHQTLDEGPLSSLLQFDGGINEQVGVLAGIYF